jgi:ATP-dependent RNA helicase RhlE
MTFQTLGVHPTIVRAVTAAGYTTPTPVQAQAIPIVLEGRDLIACAQTGTGKTAAFLLPTLQRLADGPSLRRPRALVVTPTRELAAQVGDMANRYSAQLELRSAVVVGGVGMGPQIRSITRGLDLLIATPGRLLDHLGRGNLRLGAVEIVVFDEADRMHDMGFLPAIRQIVAALPTARQSLFFSATMPDEIEALIRRSTVDPAMVEVAKRATPAEAVRQVVHPVEAGRKKELLRHLLGQADIGPTLVFTRTKARANQLVRHLERSGRKVTAIHGNKSQAARTRALAGFRSGRIDTLIATDLAARGLDVQGVTHVVNFDLPHVPEDYVHRIGRTARAGRSGDAISLAAPEERAQLSAIERLVGSSIRCEPLLGFEVPATSRAQIAVQPHRSGRPHRSNGRGKPWIRERRRTSGSGQRRRA